MNDAKQSSSSDVFTPAKRSEVMSRIRSRGNKDTELALVTLFRRHGITGWRRHREIRGPKTTGRRFRVRPDFVFPRLKVAVFVDGCFWHGCPRHATRPKNNEAFWRRKLDANRVRDRLVNRTLRRAGWRVLRIWEHDLVPKQEARLLARLRRFLHVAASTAPGADDASSSRSPARIRDAP